MGSGNIDVGSKTPSQNTSAASALRFGEPKPLSKERPRISTAMAQQSGDFGRGNQSAPQKLLQLVGYREPKARPAAWVRPRGGTVKA